MVQVRIATVDDAKAILDIYTAYVINTAYTFETEVPSIEAFENRIENCLQKFPWIVCEVDENVAGYVYASSHREREAYQWTCECSVYVHDDFKGKGIGKVLYSVLFKLLKMQKMVNVYAGITLPNEASVKLHEKCGFQFFALYENIGYELASWRKVGWWKLQLSTYLLNPPPPITFSEMNHQFFSEIFSGGAHRIEMNLMD